MTIILDIAAAISVFGIFSSFRVLSGSKENPLNLGDPWSFFFSESLLYSEKARNNEITRKLLISKKLVEFSVFLDV